MYKTYVCHKCRSSQLGGHSRLAIADNLRLKLDDKGLRGDSVRVTPCFDPKGLAWIGDVGETDFDLLQLIWIQIGIFTENRQRGQLMLGNERQFHEFKGLFGRAKCTEHDVALIPAIVVAALELHKSA